MVLQVVPARDSVPLVFEEPVVRVADDQLGRACAGDRSCLALGVSEGWVDDPGVLVGDRELPGPAPVQFNEYRDLSCASGETLIVAEDLGHGFTSLRVVWRVCLDSSSGVSVDAPCRVVENHGRHDLYD